MKFHVGFIVLVAILVFNTTNFSKASSASKTGMTSGLNGTASSLLAKYPENPKTRLSRRHVLYYPKGKHPNDNVNQDSLEHYTMSDPAPEDPVTTDNALVSFCFASLLKGDWTQKRCLKLQSILDPVFVQKTTQPNTREVFRREAFIRRLREYCSNMTPKPETAEKACKLYNLRLTSDCFFAEKKNPFCRMIRQGPSRRMADFLKYFQHLHNLYADLKKHYIALQNLVSDCYLNHYDDEAPQCRGISWRRHAPETRMEAKAFAHYDRMVKLQIPRTHKNATTITTAASS